MNKKKMLGTLAMSLVLMGYVTATAVADPALHGRWVSDDGGVELRFNNGHIEFWESESSMMRGTYTTSANMITIHFTEFYGGFLSILFEASGIPMDFPSSWFTQSKVITTVENGLEDMGIPSAMIPDVLDLFSEVFGQFFSAGTGAYEVSGNTLTMTLLAAAVAFTRVN